jgi:hypothetical protein
MPPARRRCRIAAFVGGPAVAAAAAAAAAVQATDLVGHAVVVFVAPAVLRETVR